MAFNLRDLKSFGEIAAEDDEVIDYFLTTEAAEKIASGSEFLVLGRKGSGKTALVRHFSEGTSEPNSRALGLSSYPWNVHAKRADAGASDIESYVASWLYLIAIEVASLVVSRARRTTIDPVPRLNTFLRENYGKADVALDEILRPSMLKLSKASFEPTILGNKLGSLSLERSENNRNFGLELNTLSSAILKNALIVADREKMRSLLLHFDELDHGVSEFEGSRALMIIGLILAARRLAGMVVKAETKLKSLVYLRSDIWDKLEFSDKNKLASRALTLEWTPEVLKKLVENRLRARLGPKATWEAIIDEQLMRGSQSKWNHVLARTFMRPRDVISFLNVALHQVLRRKDKILVFENKDMVEARPPYSKYLKEELDDEILPHWRDWDQALQAFSVIGTMTFQKRRFQREYTKRRSEPNPFSADEALSALYRFSVIGYERRSGYGGQSWSFQYIDPDVGYDSSATRFKVHAGLKEVAKLKEERDTSILT